ncbi:hypothetical protein LHJ74_27200 [Streptomyces sp. N2-109]|uniref:LysR substrate-binding domain-containing protein n=1 Tax=Streptomyces gossypii TaxID=2883101 RepID=A0ABT2K051_9ACTN|nr:LysR substrate-binding domain-containing protein [Streptomyces gossypii]MCT2593547.1 hypothetical protein [Streptomyces gossypii]
MREVADATFVDMPRGSGQRKLVDDAFTRAELARRVLIEVSDITSIPDHVAHGLGVAFLFPRVAKAAGPAVRAVPLADAELSWTLSVVTSATRHPHARRTRFWTSSPTTSGTIACSDPRAALTMGSPTGLSDVLSESRQPRPHRPREYQSKPENT